MGTVTKKERYHHGSLRAGLIDEAEALLAEVGAENWSMRAAARRLGVSPSAPYRHFADKDALIDAVALRGYGKLADGYRRALRACRTDGERVVAVALAYYTYGVTNPELFALMFSSPRLHATPEALASYQVFEDEVAAAQQRGELCDGPARSLAHVLWGAAHGVTELVNRGILGRRHGDLIARLAIASTVAGLRIRPDDGILGDA